jgi:hypothetical protein
MQAHLVMVLVTRAAFDRVDPFAIGPPPNLHGVAMVVIPLTRIVSRGVAIHASGVTEYGHKGLEGRNRSSIVGLRCFIIGFVAFAVICGSSHGEYKPRSNRSGDRN